MTWVIHTNFYECPSCHKEQATLSWESETETERIECSCGYVYERCGGLYTTEYDPRKEKMRRAVRKLKNR